MRYVVSGLIAWVLLSIAFAAGWATRAMMREREGELGPIVVPYGSNCWHVQFRTDDEYPVDLTIYDKTYRIANPRAMGAALYSVGKAATQEEES